MKSESTESSPQSKEVGGVELEPTPETWKIAGKIADISKLGLCEEKTLLARAIAHALTTRAVNSSATQNQDQEPGKGREGSVAATVVVSKDNSLHAVQSRLIRLAAALVTADGFLSPFTEDNLSSTPRAVLKVAEYQREKLRLWGIEAREIADSITPPSLPESESSSAQQVAPGVKPLFWYHHPDGMGRCIVEGTDKPDRFGFPRGIEPGWVRPIHPADGDFWEAWSDLPDFERKIARVNTQADAISAVETHWREWLERISGITFVDVSATQKVDVEKLAAECARRIFGRDAPNTAAIIASVFASSAGQVEDALKELRETLPTFNLRRVTVIEEEEYGNRTEIALRAQTGELAEFFEGATLAEAMSKVREWNQKEKN